jgi:hypothetical protein
MTVDGWKPYIVKPFQEPMQTTMTGRDMSTENTTEDQEYDVVLDTLQKHRNILWKMTQQNMNMDMFNIMDQIRLEQIDQLDKAMELWKNKE